MTITKKSSLFTIKLKIKRGAHYANLELIDKLKILDIKSLRLQNIFELIVDRSVLY